MNSPFVAEILSLFCFQNSYILEGVTVWEV